MSDLKNPKGHKPDPGSEYVTLIRLIGQPSGMGKHPDRTVAIQSAINGLDSMADIRNRQSVREYLYVALALAGGRPPEGKTLKLLQDNTTPKEILVTLLEGLNRTNVPIRALPRLLELTVDSWNYVYSPGVGPPRPEKVFPVRNAVFECLKSLGINAKKNLVPEKEPDRWGRRLTMTEIAVDRASLVAKLRDWILDDKPDVWQAAMEVVHKIPGVDISTMVEGLLKTENLPKEKKDALR